MTRQEKTPSRLIRPSARYQQSFLKMVDDFKSHGFDGFDDFTNLEQYLKQLDYYSNEHNLKSDEVPSSTYWLLADGEIVGEATLRHKLNSKLLTEGGHIGYGVSPSYWRRGYGNSLFKFMLEKARKFGLKKALVTCNKTNRVSAKIIAKNGGISENEVIMPDGRTLQRYWIVL